MVDKPQLVAAGIFDAPGALASRACPACGATKKPGYAFCRPDFQSLGLAQRLVILRGARDAEFAAVYGAAVADLKKHPAARVAGVGWPYRSPHDLAAAGYVYLDSGHCSAPRCGREVEWFRTPDGRRVAVNSGTAFAPRPSDWQPHRLTCKDPGFAARRAQFAENRRALAAEKRSARRRKLQTSAGGRA